MKKDIAKLFKIQGLIFYTLFLEGERLILKVGNPRKMAYCPRCKKVSKTIHQHQKERLILHMVLDNKKVYLAFKPRRFKCKVCQRPFTERIKGLSPYKRNSEIMESLVIKNLKWQPFKALLFNLGLGFKSAREILFKKLDPLIASFKNEEKELEIHLGIDEYHFKQNEAVVLITNLSKKTIKTILPDAR